MKKTVLALSLSSALAFPLAAHAQATSNSAAQASQATDQGATSNADIIVTATRTASLLSKTPITLTAITGDQLTSRGVTNPTALTDVVPNLVIDRGNANGLQINIRGITSNGTTQPSAAFLLDGIYVAQPNAQEVAMFDLDHVEVLRGPQGTLYGRNTTAGVVNIISADPKPVFGASLEGSYGNYGAANVTAMVNAPLTDTLAARFAFNYERRDTYYTQAVPQAYKNPLDTNNKSLRFSTSWKPSDAFKWLVKLDYSFINGAGAGFGNSPLISNFYAVPLAVPATGQRTADPVYLNPSADAALAKTYANSAPFSTNDSTWGATSTTDWHFGKNWTATLLAGYREYRRNDLGSVFWGGDYTTATPVYSVYNASNKQFSQASSEEGRIAYDDGKLKVQTGFYHFNTGGTSTIIFGSFGLLALPGGWTDSLGAFGQATYSLTDRWRVTGGVRYTRDKLSTNGGTELILGGTPRILSQTSLQGQSSKVTWKVGSDFDLTSHVMAYATVATGYKAVGFNSNCVVTTPGCQYLPETLTNYEGGLKGKFFNNMLYVAADYFHYNYKDLQISQVISQTVGGVTAPSAVTTNAAAAKVDGVELEGTFAPTTRHHFDFSIAWLQAHYLTYELEPGVAGAGNFNNNKLDHAPTWSLSGGYTYRYPLANGASIEAGVHSKYVTAQYIINSSVNAQFVQPAFHKTDLHVRYTTAGDRWYVEGYAKNLENKIDVTYINTAPGWSTLNNGTVSTGDPRTYGVRAGLKF